MRIAHKAGLLTFLLIFFVFALCSCEIILTPGFEDPLDGQPGSFWAHEMNTNNTYPVKAQLLAENEFCKVWGDEKSGVDEAEARKMADVYKNIIYKKMIDTFSFSEPVLDREDGIVIANNAMELADYLGDGDRKLTILLLDIKDDYEKGKNDSYVGGYFWSGNFISNEPYSNKCDMIYVDTYPGEPGSPQSNETVAHEMQHMMNFVTSYLSTTRKGMTMDTWIDEGLSVSAEWLISGEHPLIRWKWYDLDESGLIQKGNNFFVWANHAENQDALLDDYSTAYLFFQWLRLQSGGKSIYKEIITSVHSDHRAVTAAAGNFNPVFGDWKTLLSAWFAANYINAPSGPYGYSNDPVLKEIKAKTLPASINKTIRLYPGEGVYSHTNAAGSTPSVTGNIYYAGLQPGGTGNVDSSVTYSGGALLTYNSNTNIGGRDEAGTITGIAASVSGTNVEQAEGRLLRQGGVYPFPGPFPISAGDMLRRNGHEGSFIVPLPLIRWGDD